MVFYVYKTASDVLV